MLRIVSQRPPQHAGKSLDGGASRGQQQQGQSDLSRDQPGVYPSTSNAAGEFVGAGLNDVINLSPRRFQRRKYSKKHTRQHCQANAESQNREIYVEVGFVGEGIFGQPRHDEPQGTVGQQHAQSRPNHGEQQRLSQQLPHQPESGCSHGRAYCKLVLAGGTSRQQQNRNIAATNHQQ